MTAALSKLEFGQGSQVNVPIGVLLWLMIYPMMLKVDFSALGGIARKPKGLLVTLFVNWVIKPFSIALLAWVFMQHVFAAWIDPETARNYTAGLIILAAAPCTAMVFVWSCLTDGDPAYTLGNIVTDTFADLRSTPAMAALRARNGAALQTLDTCPNVAICNGWCPHERYTAVRHDPEYSAGCCGLGSLIDHMRARLAASPAA